MPSRVWMGRKIGQKGGGSPALQISHNDAPQQSPLAFRGGNFSRGTSPRVTLHPCVYSTMHSSPPALLVSLSTLSLMEGILCYGEEGRGGVFFSQLMRRPALLVW